MRAHPLSSDWVRLGWDKFLFWNSRHFDWLYTFSVFPGDSPLPCREQDRGDPVDQGWIRPRGHEGPLRLLQIQAHRVRRRKWVESICVLEGFVRTHKFLSHWHCFKFSEKEKEVEQQFSLTKSVWWWSPWLSVSAPGVCADDGYKVESFNPS